MVLTLTYGNLTSAIKNSNKLADELADYCNKLSEKVQREMYDVEGGMSSALNNADYYVNAKMKSLQKKEGNARDLSTKTQSLLDTAKRVDGDVKNMIEAEQKAFFEKNPDMKPSNVKLCLTALWCGAKNLPILGDIIKGVETVAGALSTLKKDIRHWWECGGGKELVMNSLDIVVKIGLAVAAVLTAVMAVVALATAAVVTGGMIIFAVATVVAAAIAVVNAATNIVTSVQAITTGSEDPAMAKIYGERDTLPQVLREENFHNRFLNRLSNVTATAIEVTEAVAGIVIIVHTIGNIAGKFLTKHGVGFAFKELARDSQGNLVKKVTLKSIWKGTKAMILDKPLTANTSAGVRTTLINSVKESVALDKALFKLALRDPKGWLTAKRAGSIGFWGDLKNSFTSQFKANISVNDPEIMKKLKQVSQIVTVSNGAIGNIDLTIKGLDNADGKGVAYRIGGKYVGKLFLKNDWAKLSNNLGVSFMIANLDKSGYIKDYTGSKKGLIQKIQDITKSLEGLKKDMNHKSINVRQPSFKERYPYFKYTEEAYNAS